MICLKWLLALMLACFTAGLVFGAAYHRELIEAVWRAVP